MTVMDELEQSRDAAIQMDQADPLSRLRDSFFIPVDDAGDQLLYFCGNSLGLQPKGAADHVMEVMEEWARRAVNGHQQGSAPWYPYHELFRETGARLVGARPGEVVMMNSLTINLHMLLTSFYRPEGRRRKILMESPAFPSDSYCLQSHVKARGLDHHEVIVQCGPRDGENCLRTEDIISTIEKHGDELATIMLGGVNFLTGQSLDLQAITEAGHRAGAMVGFDLAHAAGNVVMHLHDWDVDFGAWCSYKYLNASPGAIAGAYVHERHGNNRDLPRLAGWWGNDPDTRFGMHLNAGFIPVQSADSWQCSNPPVMAMTPVLASLDLFDQVGMSALRDRSLRLTAFLRGLINRPDAPWRIITPADDASHGAQLSVELQMDAKAAQSQLHARGVVCDVRPPRVIRIAPAPLYCTFEDCWRVADAMQALT